MQHKFQHSFNKQDLRSMETAIESKLAPNHLWPPGRDQSLPDEIAPLCLVNPFDRIRIIRLIYANIQNLLCIFVAPWRHIIHA